MNSETVAEIFATYRKYGWIPRRLLITADSTILFINPESDVPVFEADTDAAWFSRPPAKGEIPWEIRYLGNTPYALVENLDETSPDFEVSLKSVQAKLTAAVASKRH